MKLIETNRYEAQLRGDQVFIYFENYSDVLNIDGIEEEENPQEVIDRELELMARDSHAIGALLME